MLAVVMDAMELSTETHRNVDLVARRSKFSTVILLIPWSWDEDSLLYWRCVTSLLRLLKSISSLMVSL